MYLHIYFLYYYFNMFKRVNLVFIFCIGFIVLLKKKSEVVLISKVFIETKYVFSKITVYRIEEHIIHN